MNGSKNTELLRVLQSRLGTSQYDRWSLVRWQWYDYVRLAGAVQTQLNFLVNPQGASDPVSGAAKSLEETNMNKNRSFGQTYFLLEAIRTHINPLPKGLQPAGINDDADLIFSSYRDLTKNLIKITESGVLQIKFGSKDYYEVPKPFLACPPGFGLNIDEHAAVGDYSCVAQIGNCARDIYQLSPIQLIEPEQNVDVKISFPDGSPATITDSVNLTTPSVNVGLILDGYIARPLQ